MKTHGIGKTRKEKIFLAIAPFWDPLIPPQGIASLKAFLQEYGYNVTTVDANIEPQFLEMYHQYFNFIKEHVPERNHGNFYSIGHFVLQNQMMAHFNHEDEARYIKLTKILVYKTFFVDFDDSLVLEMNKILGELYTRLKNYFLNLLGSKKPGVFGLTVTTGTFPASLFLFKLVKEKYPHIKTIMGGNIFADQLAVDSPNFEYLLECTRNYIDKFIVGQGELLLLKYVQGELPGSQRVYTKKDLNGRTLGFSELKLPDLSDYNVSAYPYLAAVGSTSCKFQCSFCNSAKYWGEFREKDTAQTAREMEELYQKYSTQLFFMIDSMLNPIITELSKEILKLGVPLYFDAYFRVDEDSADPEKTLAWRHGGFYRARIGVETGSQHVLDLIGKEITVDQIRTAIKGLSYAGIKTTTYWVIGHPGETGEDFLQTLDLLEELKEYIWQAECAQFDYYYDGQTKSDYYADKRMLLYPQWAKDMLISQSWIVDCPPSREETYQRIFRFVQRCRELGIPNPYSLQEIKKADDRWQQLHKNAVPPLMDFKKGVLIDERNRAIKFLLTQNRWNYDGDFGF